MLLLAGPAKSLVEFARANDILRVDHRRERILLSRNLLKLEAADGYQSSSRILTGSLIGRQLDANFNSWLGMEDKENRDKYHSADGKICSNFGCSAEFPNFSEGLFMHAMLSEIH